MEMTNFFNDSELVALNAQEMEDVQGGGWADCVRSFIAGMISEMLK
jgi:hypothetical protein